jgi:hypothetical protein
MPWKQIRLPVLITAALVVLALLIGGRYLYQQQYVNQGFMRSASKITKIEEMKISSQDNPPTVYLRIPPTSNLRSDYNQLQQLVQEQLGANYRLVLLDSRTAKLDALEGQCQFAIQEAIVDGSFLEMQSTVNRLAKADGVSAQVAVDSDNVYLALRSGTHYLYEIIQRNSGVQAESGQIGGNGS